MASSVVAAPGGTLGFMGRWSGRLRFSILAMCLAACSEIPVGPDVPLRLEASLERSTISFPDTVRITLTIANPGPASVTVRFNSLCHFSFEVRDAARQQVGPEAVLCAAAISHRTFARGIDTVEFIWTGESTAGASSRVPPGQYSVVAGLGVPLRAESAPVSLVIQ